MIVEYDGSRYHGSQYQENAPTVQAELESALGSLTAEVIRIAAASRTDAGVHAEGQVISFLTDTRFPMETWVKGMNFYLSPDVAVKAAYEVPGSFDVRRHALSRRYRYTVLNSRGRSPLKRRFTYLVPHALNVAAMNCACDVLIGEHDFSPFASATGRRTERRVLRAEWEVEEDVLAFYMEADSFLPHQVRNTVGGLLRVGQGKMEVDTFWSMARSGRPGVVGPAAPAHGLCLSRVNYDGFPPCS